MKNILALFILIVSHALYGNDNIERLNENQQSIIKKIVLNEGFLDKSRYDEFWKNSAFKKNSIIQAEILKKYNEVYELKLDLWQSAKISYKYLDIIKTKQLEDKYHKLEETDKINIFNILLASKIHDDVSIVNNNKVHFNLLFIENMLQKQKNILIALNQLFNPVFKCSFDLSNLDDKYNRIKVCPTIGYEYFSGGLFKKYVFRYNNTMVSFNLIRENINLNTCLNIIANNFFLKDLDKVEKSKKEFFRQIEKDKFVLGKCIQNNNGTLMLYLYGTKNDIEETIAIIKK